MSEVAGRMAVQEGAKYLEKVYGGSGILLGGVPGVLPAEVLIIGGGVVGANAAKMAAGLGARVTLLDLSLDRLRYLADVLPSNVDLLYSNRHNLVEQLQRADLVIGAVLLPGAKAPKLVRRDDLKLMKPGSVRVGVAGERGWRAPGINSVIGAATIRARLEAVDVLGVRDGFEWIMQGDIDHVTPLDIGEVSRIHFRGGSYIGISRANPTQNPAHLDNAVLALLRLNVSQLITIGGDDTAYSAMKLEEKAAGRLQVVHVPKTIDNDLDLPPHVDTFGFQTARHYGVEIVKNLMVDARTTSRWYLVITMGRGAGHLAVGIGKAAGATLTLIPEEFLGRRIRLKAVVDTLVCAIIKRLSYGRLDGVAVVAEGLTLGIDPAELAGVEELERDTHGNVRIAEVNIGEILKAAVQKRLKEFGLKATIAAKNIGYELRCADPIPMDMEYTRDLGYCAAKYVLGGGNAAVISLQAGRFVPIPFAAMIDPGTGRTRTRRVDITSTRYAIARRYMIRLRRDDFDDPHELARFAATAHVSVEEFRRQFEYLIEEEPPPLVLDAVGERDPGALA